MLNASKGAAVRGPRVQADRRRYKARDPRAARRAGRADDRRGRGGGAACSTGAPGHRPACSATAASSTRRRGDPRHRHLPRRQAPFRHDQLRRRPGRRAGGDGAGRSSCARSTLPIARLKTGTPPRLDGRTIDWARARAAAVGRRRLDDVADERRAAPRRSCSARSPAPMRAPTRSSAPISTARRLFAGEISGVGPRYCPSIEDKVHRFADRDGHQIFLEPEGLDDPTDLSQRHLDLAARGRPARDGPLDARGSSAPRSSSPAMRSNMIMSIRASSSRRCAVRDVDGPVSRRPDQRHDRL